MLDNIRIVLVNPSHPGNIGAAARAMKTMGLKHLYLVAPKSFPNVNATAMAAGADDILAKATVVSTLAQALQGTKIAFGTSARERALALVTHNPKEAASIITRENKANNIAVVFGRENNGLTNEELGMCNYHIHIASNPDFSSLNIAQAVQLIAYEIKEAGSAINTTFSSKEELATNEEIQNFYEHLKQALVSIKFLNSGNEKRIMAKLKRLFNRAKLEETEVGILRGILTTIKSYEKE
jgi:tRNA (cytidine32/uridine32-2'-O)-methyltransferase